MCQIDAVSVWHSFILLDTEGVENTRLIRRKFAVNVLFFHRIAAFFIFLLGKRVDTDVFTKIFV